MEEFCWTRKLAQLGRLDLGLCSALHIFFLKKLKLRIERKTWGYLCKALRQKIQNQLWGGGGGQRSHSIFFFEVASGYPQLLEEGRAWEVIFFPGVCVCKWDDSPVVTESSGSRVVPAA